MISIEEVRYVRELYEIIFNEIANNSKEFCTFVVGIPNPLRIKIEDWLVQATEENTGKVYPNLMRKMDAARDLDLFITNYIENNYE